MDKRSAPEWSIPLKDHSDISTAKGMPLRAVSLSGLAFFNAIACCSWPAVLSVLGVGSAGLGDFFHKWQPLITGSAFIFLGIAFYGVYLQKGCLGKRSLTSQVILWASAIGTLYFTIPHPPYFTMLFSTLSFF